MARTVKSSRFYLIYGVIIIIFLTVYLLSGLALTPNAKQSGANTMRISLYFLNMANNNLEREIRAIETPGSNKELINSVLKELIKGPENSRLYRTIPRDVTILSANLVENEKLFEINLSEEYYALPVKDEIFCRSSLVWTFTEFDFIEDVTLYVSGGALVSASGKTAGVMNRDGMKVNPELSPFPANTRVITLYFANEQLQALTPEARTIEVSTNIEYSIVEQLIKGPVKPELNSVISPDLKLKATNTTDGICYVDLGPEFSRSLTGMDTDRLAVSSIVNSLTELSGVQMVQIIVDSSTVKETWGGYDLSMPIARDENVIDTSR